MPKAIDAGIISDEAREDNEYDLERETSAAISLRSKGDTYECEYHHVVVWTQLVDHQSSPYAQGDDNDRNRCFSPEDGDGLRTSVLVSPWRRFHLYVVRGTWGVGKSLVRMPIATAIGRCDLQVQWWEGRADKSSSGLGTTKG